MSRILEIDEIMSILRTTEPALRSLVGGAHRDDRQPTAFEADWSVAGVLAHLLACNDVLGGNMLRILREDHPAWRSMSPRTWQRKSGYHDWPVDRTLEAFATGRADLLEVLNDVLPGDWDRTATVTVPPKKVFEYSVRYYGDWLAGHERTHLKNLQRALVSEQGT